MEVWKEARARHRWCQGEGMVGTLAARGLARGLAKSYIAFVLADLQNTSLYSRKTKKFTEVHCCRTADLCPNAGASDTK